MNCKAGSILVSNNIFTAKKDAAAPFDGFVAIKKNKILAVRPRNQMALWAGNNTKVTDLGDPGAQ